MSSLPRGPLTRAAIALTVGTCVLAAQAIVPLSMASAQSMGSRPALVPRHHPVHPAGPAPAHSRPVPWSARTARPVLHIRRGPDAATLRRLAIANAGKTDKTATYRVSPAFLRFLTAGLGMKLGRQTLLAGVKAGADLNAGLPGPRLPWPWARFTSSVLSIDPATGAATLAASRAGAALRITIADAAGQTVTAVTGELRLPVRVAGRSVVLSGPVSYHPGGRLEAALAGRLATAEVIKAGAAELDAGARVTLAPDGTPRVAGQARLGPPGRQLEASVSGSVTAGRGWVLRVGSVSGRAPLPGLALAPAASGTVTRTGYDVLAHAARAWTPAAGITFTSAAVTFADGRFPSGGLIPAPGITSSTPWADVAGTVTVKNVSTRAIVAINLASGAGLLTTTGKTPVSLRTATGRLITDAAGFRVALNLSRAGHLAAGLPAGLSAWAARAAWAARTASRGRPGRPATNRVAQKRTATTAGAYTLSSAVYSFLKNTLSIPLGSATLNGTVSGSTLTLTAGAPTALPSSLPSWLASPSFVNTQLSVDESTGTLTLTAATGTGGGQTATLNVTIANASTSDLTDGTDVSGTLTLTGVPFTGGSAAALAFTLGYTGGALSASLTGTLTSAATFGPVTIPAGATLGLAAGSGLTIAGAADFTAGSSITSVLIHGALTDLSDWSLTVATDPDASTWMPATGLSITPDFTGSITDKAGTVGFDVTSQGPDVAAWTSPDGSSMVTVSTIEVSNQAPAGGGACSSSQVKDGDLWAGVAGTYAYSPANLNLNATGCFDLTGRSAAIATSATGNLTGAFGGGLPFTVTAAALNASVASGGAFSLTGTATVTITQGLPSDPAFNVGLSLSNSGIVAGATIPDLSSLGFSGNGALYVSTAAVSGFDPSTIGLTGQSPFDLPAGLAVTLDYTLPSGVVSQIQQAIPGFPAGSAVQAMATLSTTGFTVGLGLNFGTGPGGLTVFSNDNSALYLDNIMLELRLGTQDQLSLSGTGYLRLPPVSPGGVISDVTVTLGASFNFTTDTFSFTFNASNWNGAFGVDGFNIGSLSGALSVTGELVPGIDLGGSQITLPPHWANAIGMVPGTQISFDADLELSSPRLEFALENPAGASYPTLLPLSLVSGLSPNVVNSLVVDQASFSVAPTAASLVFNVAIDGVTVDVGASVQLGASPSVNAMVSAPPFNVAGIQVSNTQLNLSVNTSGFQLAITGGTSYDGYSFHAGFGLALGNSMNGAIVSLSLTGGLPSYFAAGASLAGAVSGDGSGASISATGSGWLSAGGSTLGPVSFNLSVPGGLSWSDVSNSITQLASFFINNAGLSVTQTGQALQQFGYTLYDTFNAVSSIGDYGQQILSDVAGAFGLSSTYFNIWTYTSAGEILTLDVNGGSQAPNTNVITWTYNGGYNQEWAFVQSPYSGWYELVNRGSGQCLTVEGNNSTPGNPLIQYPCAGAWNQLWYMGNIALNTNYVITSALDGEVADVQNADPWPGGYLDQWSYNGGWNQQFWLTNGEN